MTTSNPAVIRALAADIEAELGRLERLEASILQVQSALTETPGLAPMLYENLALKLHNFYTGCEKIMQLVAVELNGGLPSGADWHKRLLDRMSQVREGRPAVFAPATAARLREFLGFRHIVRNLYGFELEPDRVARLIEQYPSLWLSVRQDIKAFVLWLEGLAEQISRA